VPIFFIFNEKDSLVSIKIENYEVHKNAFKKLDNNISLLDNIAEFQYDVLLNYIAILLEIMV